MSSGDASGDAADSLDRTGFLLQRLQELKAWQREQEENLLREQELQMDRLVVDPDYDNEEEDDTTIDQDLSSLASVEAGPLNDDEQVPSWASRSGTSLEVDNHDEQPIVAKCQTFEQLLAQHDLDDGEKRQQDKAFVKAKPFLRRGSGLARYGGVGGGPKKLTTPKMLRRCNSQAAAIGGNDVNGPITMKASTSCPKINSVADRQTISSASKKTKRVATTKVTTLPQPRRTNLKLKTKKLQSTTDSDNNAKENGLYDSVELSFMEKLEKADQSHQKDLEDLRAFEMLEEAACDSSFCSTSSTVKRLIQNANMPSPIVKSSLTSTPNAKAKCSSERQGSSDSSCGDSLMKDIRAFLENKGAVIKDNKVSSSDDNEDDTLIEDDEEEEEENNGIIMEREPMQSKHKDILNPSESDEEDSDSWNEIRSGGRNRKQNHVRFREDDDNAPMSFSPPRVPKHSPSYLIWSIFTKEREEREQKTRQSKTKRAHSADRDSPMSRVNMQKSNEYDFETTLLNAKLTELEKEIGRFRKENDNLVQARRKLQQDRKQLAKDVDEFEKNKEMEKKKLDEDKKRFRRERNLFEKSQKDKRSGYDKKSQDEIDDLQSKINRINEDLQRKDSKWSTAVSKLQEQVKLLEKENQQLHEDNHKLKLKGVSSKISTRLIDPSLAAATKKTALPQAVSTKSGTPDSGFRSQDNNHVEEKMASTPTLAFSPADSLDSSMTLVSAGITTKASNGDVEGCGNELLMQQRSKESSEQPVVVKSVNHNEAKGTTEKVYSDGSVEICYSNGNRKEVSSDGATTKVYYYNGDVKETLASGLVKYFYSQTRTWHLTYPDGKEVLQFSNGQEEIRYPSGILQISFADGSVKKIDTDGTENIKFPDGTTVIVQPNGDRTLLLPSGQKEIHTATYKRREYPDGTIKILYDDGKQETRYTSGRIRIKDREGKLLHDSQATATAS